MQRGRDHAFHRKPLQGVSSSLCVLAAIQQWRSEGRIAAWLHIPILQSHFIAPAASLGFCFHHTKPHSSTLTLWLGEGPSRLPGYATHQVGVAGQFWTQELPFHKFTMSPWSWAASLSVNAGQWVLCDCATVVSCFSKKKGCLPRELQASIENKWKSSLPKGYI